MQLGLSCDRRIISHNYGAIDYLSRLFHVIIEIRIHTGDPDIFIYKKNPRFPVFSGFLFEVSRLRSNSF
jgi:hypothetical protein